MQFVGIKHMHGLAQLQHHIVADVDQRRNRADAAALQALLQPFGRDGTRIHVFNYAADKAAAVLRCINTHRLGFAALHRGRLKRQRPVFTLRERRHFARQAFDAQAIGAVGRDFERHQHIIERQIIADILPHRRIGRQNVQAVHTVIGQAQFIGGTQHAVRGLPAHFGGLDFKVARQHRTRQSTRHLDAGGHIRRTAHDLNQLARAGIHLGNIQAVGIRVFFNRFHFGNHHAAESRRGGFHFFYFQARHGEQMRHFIGGKIGVGLGFEPIIRKLHDILLFCLLRPSETAVCFHCFDAQAACIFSDGHLLQNQIMGGNNGAKVFTDQLPIHNIHLPR